VVEFLGRSDRQVKIRGHRIELGEIEFALDRLPSVRESVVVAAQHGPDDVRLIAYVVPTSAGFDPVAARHDLQLQLPASSLPARIVPLDVLPLTANGKIDVRALPAPSATTAVTTAARTLEPSTDLEREIAAIWRDVLGLEDVGMSDNFFDIGGHSLLMVQVHARLAKLVEHDVPLLRLLEHPTVASLAAHLSAAEPAGAALAESRERAHRQRNSRRVPAQVRRGGNP
jgi:hypothetical protein